jgi:hypothetical protein
MARAGGKSSSPFREKVTRAAFLSAAARAVAAKAGNTMGALDLLEKEGLTEDAIRFCARFLATRAAVWWGCLCLWHVERPQPAEKLEAALAAAAHWAGDPSETKRRDSGRAGESASFGTAAGCLAMAAFYSGGSMLDAKLPAVAPPPDLAAETVAAAVLLAGGGPPTSPQLHRQFIALARGVADGSLPLPDADKEQAAKRRNEDKPGQMLAAGFDLPAEPAALIGVADGDTGSIARHWDESEDPKVSQPTSPAAPPSPPSAPATPGSGVFRTVRKKSIPPKSAPPKSGDPWEGLSQADE